MTDFVIIKGSMKALLCAVAVLCSIRCFGAQVESSGVPNVLLIYADDLGYGDVSCYNPTRGKIPTPHIDQLAARGMRFTDAHSSSGVCSPSRYTLLTGRYHWRSRLQRGIVGLWGPPLIPAERLTLAGLTAGSGFQSACIGKWHLGWDWPIPDDLRPFFATTGYGGRKDLTATDDHREAWRKVFSQPIPGGPTAVGFDAYFGTDVPNWPPYCFIRDDQTVGIPATFADPSLFGKNQASQQGPALEGWTLEPILPELTLQAEKFINQQKNGNAPWFLYLSLTSPHTPLSVNSPWNGRSSLNPYADFVMETDAMIGRVLQALEESGEANDTLVIFTSDNGCAPYIGVEDLEKAGHYPSGPFRGYKADAWEGGHRVPFIVSWPGVVKRGSECDELVHQADIFATMAAILGRDLPVDAAEDSFNILPLLKGQNVTIRETSVSCSINGVPSFRLGPWKYIPAPGSGGWGRGGDQSHPVQLYNLELDPSESQNMAAEEPELLDSMKQTFERIILQGRSNPGLPVSNDVDVIRYP
jgi:arylsulfatase A-like enzyme